MPRGRRVPRQDIISATQILLAAKGTAVTMDEIAAAAEVGRRTLFRHFATKGELIAEAMRGGWDRWTTQAVVPVDGDLQAAVGTLLERAHVLNAGAGLGFWELASGLFDDPELHEAADLRATTRRAYVPAVAAQLWSKAGGLNEPPQWVVDAYALLESVHALHALRPDFVVEPAEVGTTCARIMTAVLREAVAAQPQPPRSSRLRTRRP